LKRNKVILGLVLILIFGFGLFLGIWVKNNKNQPKAEENLLPGEENYEQVPSPINVNYWVVDESQTGGGQ